MGSRQLRCLLALRLPSTSSKQFRMCSSTTTTSTLPNRRRKTNPNVFGDLSSCDIATERLVDHSQKKRREKAMKQRAVQSRVDELTGPYVLKKPVESFYTPWNESKPKKFEKQSIEFDELSDVMRKREELDRIPRITVPVGAFGTRVLKREERLKITKEVTKGPLLIECSRSDFNMHEAVVARAGVQPPLMTKSWKNSKHVGEWIIIRRTQHKAPGVKQEEALIPWSKFGEDVLDTRLKENASREGWSQPTKVQAEAILAFTLSTQHIFIASETGSGKTAAYTLPLLNRLIADRKKGESTRGIVVVMSTFLKKQVCEAIQRLSSGTGLKVIEVEKYDKTRDNDWDVLVGTPGLVARELKIREKKEAEVKELVIDEADAVLDDSFVNVLSDLLAQVPVSGSATKLDNTEGARVTFASATCPKELENLAAGVVNERRLLYIKSSFLHQTLPNLELKLWRVREKDKVEHLKGLLAEEDKSGGQSLVFCKDRKTAAFVTTALQELRADVQLIKVGEKMEYKKESKVFVSTDLAARGVDIPTLTHVICYDMAHHLVDWIHRVGRVGRMGSRREARVTAFVRTLPETKLAQVIELSARLGKPIEGIEANVASKITSRGEDEDDEGDEEEEKEEEGQEEEEDDDEDESESRKKI